MSNPLTGEVSLTVGGDTLKLKFSTQALIEVEEALNISALELPGLLRRPRLKHVRVLLWAALRDYHSDISLVAAGDLISKVGMIEVMDRVGAAVMAAFPAPKKKDDADPQPVAAEAPPTVGTGPLSTASGSN